MDKSFNYDFLKLEFNDIYEDLNKLKDQTNLEMINKEVNDVINDIIYYISKQNKVLYDENEECLKRLEVLKEIGVIPNEIVEKIILWGKIVKSNVNKTDIEIKSSVGNENNRESVEQGLNESKSIDKNHEKEEIKKLKLIYEVLVWFVINYGSENYSLFLENLLEEEKEIFKKYLRKSKLITNNDLKSNKSMMINFSDIEEKEIELSHSLVEEGEKYYFGRGVKRNYKTAYKYFLEAAKFNDEYAESYLGLFYDRGIGISRNYEIAYQWYYKAANKGNAFSQYSIGVLYAEGNGLPKDYYKAFMWFQKSAENEYAAAYYQLGRCYYNGLGVEKDLNTAFKWHSKAAKCNFPASQYALSLMYKNGEGCEENLIRAYYWMEKAAENDYEDAYYIIGRSYLEGIYIEEDYKRAFNYLSKGYIALDTNCIESLAEMYLKGLHVKKDLYSAIELYNKAIEFGDKSIYFKLGKLYEDEGLINQAISTYEEGHEEGNLKCTQRLGIMYYNGEGIERNLEKAIEYIEFAAARKEPHAMYVLAVAYLRLNKFGEKTTEIVKRLLKEAYRLNSPYAADYLASIMINELSEKKDINRSELVEYIKFGVEYELKESIFKFGYIYEKGIGVMQDYEKAYQYYNLAAEKNCIKAMNKLGDWYKKGIFLSRNINLAIKWYEKSANKNDIDGVENLIQIYEKGIGNKRNDIKAIYYVFKLIDLDVLKGKERLIYYCYKGIGIEKNKERGNELINEIEEIDKGTANFIKANLGENNLINMSKDEIINLYKDGIELGNLNCYGNLAVFLYENDLYDSDKYKELFNIAMQGEHLGVKKCEYIYLKKKLKEFEISSIVTVEELIIIKKLTKLLNNGVYKVIDELIKWYSKRRPEEKTEYYKLMEDKIYYNLII